MFQSGIHAIHVIHSLYSIRVGIYLSEQKLRTTLYSYIIKIALLK